MSSTKEARGAGYERRDVAMSAPVALAGILVLFMGLALFASRFMLRAFSRSEDPARVERHPMAEARGRPARPLLQARPALDLAARRAWEQQTLSTYGWVDPVGGVVRIPIERAVELALEEGFPVREGGR